MGLILLLLGQWQYPCNVTMLTVSDLQPTMQTRASREVLFLYTATTCDFPPTGHMSLNQQTTMKKTHPQKMAIDKASKLAEVSLSCTSVKDNDEARKVVREVCKVNCHKTLSPSSWQTKLDFIADAPLETFFSVDVLLHTDTWIYFSSGRCDVVTSSDFQ